MIKILCNFFEEHAHEYPDDWIFGGYNGLHPGADPRYRATTYRYYDDRLQLVFFSQEFLCDYEAIDKFTRIARFANPVYLEAVRPGGVKEMLPWMYDKKTDEVEYVVRKA